jgi:type IV fimbrial biogenesis protein FimT
MVAVIIVGLLAAMATPSFIERMRDRRASQVASEIALQYRTAKARAIGRGGAQLVRYTTANNPQGDFVLMEAIQPDTQGNNTTGANGYVQSGSCGNLPLNANCNAAQWETAVAGVNANATARIVSSVPERAGTSSPNLSIKATFFAPGNVQLPSADVCFTPGGRTYFRAGGGAPFVALTSVPTVQVQRYTTSALGTAIGVLRTVIVPPNGAARLVL